MKYTILFIISTLTLFNSNAQQINGVFTDFAINNQWGNTVINTATLENSGYITLGGHYEGRTPEKKIPMLLQINAAGVIRTDFGSVGVGVALINQVNSIDGGTEILKTYIANSSNTANSNQFIIAGREVDGDGFMIKMFPTGSRPSAFNNGNVTYYTGGPGVVNGYIDDWVTGPIMYSIRQYGINYVQTWIELSAFSKETGTALASFGNNGIIQIVAPEDNHIDQTTPIRIVKPSTGTHNNKLYIAFSIHPNLEPGTSIAVCRLNIANGSVDSSYGSNGYKTFPANSRYNITSLVANDDESITVGGYGGNGLESVPSFLTFTRDGLQIITSFNYSVGQPNPGYGSKNIDAKNAMINGQERIVFAYALPINTNDQYRIAIASLSATTGAGGEQLMHTPWLGSEFVSAEPTCIITLPGNGGFIVTGNARRTNGSLVGIVLKYTNTGTLDPAFASQGVLIINGHSGGPQWNSATQLSTNKYLAVGGADFVPGNLTKKAILLNRFNSDGSIDTSFGTQGSLYSFLSDNPRNGFEIVPLPNGEFLVSGSYYSTINEPGTMGGAAGNEAILCKYNADGSIYYPFGPYNNGRFHYNGSSFGDPKIIADKIYVTANPAGVILKLTSEGNLQSSYATGLALMQKYAVNATTGFLYAGGRRNGVTAKQVVKIKPDGLVDASFGNSGYASIPIINSGDNANINELIQKPDGNLLAVMQWNSAIASYGIFFSSISDAGVLDLNFGYNGAKFLVLPGATNLNLRRHKFTGENNSKLLLYGQATVNNATQGFVCKVDLNGELDPAFGDAGVIWTTETFFGTVGFDNKGNALAIKYYRFFNGEALAKINIPADVYNQIKPGSWTGAIDNDWFNPGNWAEAVVPYEYTAVTITTGNVLIASNRYAFAWNLSVTNGATVTMGNNSTLKLTEENP